MKTAPAAAASALALLLLPAAPAAQTWTGPYVGGSIGYATPKENDNETILFDKSLDGSFGDTVTTLAGANAFSPGFCDGAASGMTPGAGCGEDDEGLALGVHAGYDQQFGNLILGGVVEFSNAEISDSVSAFSTTPASYTMTRELDSLLSARVRLGYAAGAFLPYVTAGVARGQVSHSFATTNVVNTFPQSSDDSASGYQVGLGLDAQVSPRVTVGLEYLRTSLEDDSHRVRAAGPAPSANPFILTNPAGTDFRRSEDKFEFGALRLKASFRF